MADSARLHVLNKGLFIIISGMLFFLKSAAGTDVGLFIVVAAHAYTYFLTYDKTCI